jgi:hypothetical protein
VRAALQRLDGWQTRAMESFGARATLPLDHCRSEIAASDVVILIQAGRYGSLVPGSTLSFTHHEYLVAQELKKPVLVFLEKYHALEDGLDREELEQLEEFRRVLLREAVVDVFEHSEDLATRVIAALHNWRRANERLRKASLVPIPPQPRVVHPYPIEAHFTGRGPERRLLSDWLDGGSESIFILEAMGGLGKTSLSWLWSQYDVLGIPLPSVAGRSYVRNPPATAVDGLFWWSFYETDSRFEAFFQAAVQYASAPESEDEEPRESLSAEDKLFELLKHKKILFVLDGFERELMSYQEGYQAAHGDIPPGGDSREARTCLDARAARFLKRACSTPGLAAKFLVTTRLFPANCEGHDGAPLSGCRKYLLSSFSDADVIAFFRSYGIQAPADQIQNLARKYGHHPLAVRLLAGVVKNDPFEPGEVGAAESYDPIPELIGRSHHVLQVAYESLSQQNQRLLSGIAAFRSVISSNEIEAVENTNARLEQRPPRDRQLLKAAIASLRSRNLLLFEERRRLFDLHPVVRKYAYERLLNKRDVHSGLSDYFERFAKSITVRDRQDLTPVIELFHQLLSEGSKHRALVLLHDRIFTPLVEWFHDVRTGLELFRAVTDQPLEHLPASNDVRWWFNRSYSELLRMSGLLRETLQWSTHSRSANRADELTGYSYNVKEIQVDSTRSRAERVRAMTAIGRLHDAIDTGVKMLRMLPHSPDDPEILSLGNELMFALHCAGRDAEGLRLAQTRQGGQRADVAVRLSLARRKRYHAIILLRAGKVREAYQMLMAGARFLEGMGRISAGLEEALLYAQQQAVCDAVSVEVGDRQVEGNLAYHARRLLVGLEKSRSLGFGEAEMFGLLALAQVSRAQRDSSACRHYAGLAETLAFRAGCRLLLIDSLLEFALAALAEGQTGEGRSMATRAAELCSCEDGSTYAPGLRLATSILK